jgi:hypothetical protein
MVLSAYTYCIRIDIMYLGIHQIYQVLVLSDLLQLFLSRFLRAHNGAGTARYTVLPPSVHHEKNM